MNLYTISGYVMVMFAAHQGDNLPVEPFVAWGRINLRSQTSGFSPSPSRSVIATGEYPSLNMAMARIPSPTLELHRHKPQMAEKGVTYCITDNSKPRSRVDVSKQPHQGGYQSGILYPKDSPR